MVLSVLNVTAASEAADYPQKLVAGGVANAHPGNPANLDETFGATGTFSWGICGIHYDYSAPEPGAITYEVKFRGTLLPIGVGVGACAGAGAGANTILRLLRFIPAL